MVVATKIEPKTDIVWKYPPEIFTYLRQSYAYTGRARGSLRGWSGDKSYWVRSISEMFGVSKNGENKSLMVGYEEVGERVAPRVYCRHYWWLKSYDKDIQPEGVYKTKKPCEAVDPLNIPGVILCPE